jgi:DNA methylase/ParB-like nuclease domain
MSNGVTTSLQINRLPIGQLVPDPRNPRKHSDRQVSQVAQSIASFGFNSPILIDSTGKILAGHGRWLAARKLNLKDVPTIRLEHLTESQAKAFILADNRLSEMSSFDDRLLAEALKELSDLHLDFSIEATGFSVGEIDLRIEELSTSADSNNEPELPLAKPTGIAVSQPGDLWRLGSHLVHCGNALDSHAYRILMDGKRASMAFTDPPYNVKIDGHASGLGRIHHREFAMASGEMNEAQFTSFLTIACGLMVRNSNAGSVHFVCTDWRHMGELISAGRATFSELLNLCVWCKYSAGMGSFYRSQHELIFAFKAGRASHRNNVQLGRFGRNRSNVWSYPGTTSFGRGGEEGNLAELHPTVKPVKLVADAILDCSTRGEIILDPFLGSGTTVLAAERVGRVCYGMEIDPLYVDTVIRRWQSHTGGVATHTVTGNRFDDVAADVEERRGRPE